MPHICDGTFLFLVSRIQDEAINLFILVMSCNQRAVQSSYESELKGIQTWSLRIAHRCRNKYINNIQYRLHTLYEYLSPPEFCYATVNMRNMSSAIKFSLPAHAAINIPIKICSSLRILSVCMTKNYSKESKIYRIISTYHFQTLKYSYIFL